MAYRFAAGLALVTGTLLAFAPPPVLSAGPAIDAKALLAKTRPYVADLQSNLKYGVFDEAYEQSVVGALRDDSRTMTGELFLTYLPTDDAWIAVHDVKTIDGKPVEDYEDLATLMQRGSLQSITREVTSHNARYNIGHISRNFNEPTLPLIALSKQRDDSFSFSVGSVREENGVSLTTLRFEERKNGVPLITSPAGDHLRTRGDFEVETATGRLHRTHLEVTGSVAGSDISVAHETVYAHDEASDLWLPSVFHERYEGRPQGQHEVVTCVANYTNFRRFQVLGRIK